MGVVAHARGCPVSFDRLAPHYSWMEAMLAGTLLQRCRTVFLDRLTPGASVLLLGEGHGRCLEEIVRRAPSAQVTVVDSSQGMIAQSRRRVEKAGLGGREIHYVHSDIFKLDLTARFDCVATHFFLDCFTQAEVAGLVPKIAACLRPGGDWLLSDFQIPRHPPGRWRARVIVSSAYSVFRFLTGLSARRLPVPQPCLSASGLVLRRRAEFSCGLLYSEHWQRQN